MAILDTDSLVANEKIYLELLMDLVLESPMKIGTEIVTYENVVKGINADTVDVKTVNGLDSRNNYFLYGPYISYVAINIKVSSI